MPSPSVRMLGCLVAALCALPASARAQGEEARARTSSLSWVRLAGAEACVATQDLARDVELRLGRTVFVSASQADVSVEGHVEPGAGDRGWHAAITIRDGKGSVLGTRELHRDDASCVEMREAIALVIAVMIDPDATPSPAPPPPAPPEPIVIVEKERVVVEVPVTAPPSPPAWRFDGGSAVIASAGLLPHPGVGLYAGGLLQPLNLPALLGSGAVFFDNSTGSVGGGQATVSLAFLAGGLCPVWVHRARLHFYACVGGHLGLLRSRGTGFDPSQSADQSKLYLAGAVEGRLTVRLAGPLSARAGLSLVVPVLRDTFIYRQTSGAEVDVFALSPVAGVGDLGFGVVFP